MNLDELEANRRTATTQLGAISYVDVGEGPVALFVHGVFTNALFWRDVIGSVSTHRRCVAIDLPAHGQTATDESWDLSLNGLADAVLALCDSIEVDRVDLVANDTGGAVAQIFAATNPDRVRSFVLTNCDTQANTPPPEFAPVVALARRGGLAEAVKRLATDFDLARSPAGFGSGYERPEDLTDEVLRAYTGPLAESDLRASELQRCVAQIEPGPLLAIEPRLKGLHVPTLLVWGPATRSSRSPRASGCATPFLESRVSSSSKAPSCSSQTSAPPTSSPICSATGAQPHKGRFLASSRLIVQPHLTVPQPARHRRVIGRTGGRVTMPSRWTSAPGPRPALGRRRDGATRPRRRCGRAGTLSSVPTRVATSDPCSS
jgi:pimeloyl-ACP methyl ester carboxylesterase